MSVVGECIYHQQGGRWYAKINMDSSKGKRWFCSVQEAEAAGGAVAGLVGIECGVVSGVINLESSGVEASDRRPRHDEHYHEA
jgi:hypothetical protein